MNAHNLTSITDEQMMQLLPTAKAYTVVILRSGPNMHHAEAKQITWEHARRNFAMRAAGFLSIVCPVMDNSSVRGIGIFNADEARTRQLMDEDPGVMAGIFEYEVHPCRSFPGDSLPS